MALIDVITCSANQDAKEREKVSTDAFQRVTEALSDSDPQVRCKDRAGRYSSTEIRAPLWYRTAPGKGVDYCFQGTPIS